MLKDSVGERAFKSTSVLRSTAQQQLGRREPGLLSFLMLVRVKTCSNHFHHQLATWSLLQDMACIPGLFYSTVASSISVTAHLQTIRAACKELWHHQELPLYCK